MLKEAKKASKVILQKTNLKPKIAIILGSGLGGLVNEMSIQDSIPYDSIPGFPVSTVDGHTGKLIFGKIGNTDVMVMQGRLHFYEGYPMDAVTFPVRVMMLMGIKLLILSNASGGLNPDFKVGDMMFITDHINLMPNPLIGKNYEEFGPRFPDMSDAYDHNLISKAEIIAKESKFRYQKGVYAGVSGPTYETPAEYKYLHILGADAVGMSTVPEVIIARHMGIKCFAISVISDLGVQGKIEKISHKKVLIEASSVEPDITKLIKELLNTVSG